MIKVLKTEYIFFWASISIQWCIFHPLEDDTSHQEDFPLLFIWNLFSGAKYPKPPGNIPPKVNNKYVTYVK
jgi:hypothetical protein